MLPCLFLLLLSQQQQGVGCFITLERSEGRVVAYTTIRVVSFTMVIIMGSLTYTKVRKLAIRHPDVENAAISTFRRLSLFLIIYIISTILFLVDEVLVWSGYQRDIKLLIARGIVGWPSYGFFDAVIFGGLRLGSFSERTFRPCGTTSLLPTTTTTTLNASSQSSSSSSDQLTALQMLASRYVCLWKKSIVIARTVVVVVVGSSSNSNCGGTIAIMT